MNSITTGGENYSAKVAADPEGRDAAAEGVAAAEKYLKPVPPYAQAIIAASELITRWQERQMGPLYKSRRRIIGGIAAASIALSAGIWSDLPDRALSYLDNLLGVSSVYDEHTGLCEESGGLFGEDRFVAPGTGGNCP